MNRKEALKTIADYRRQIDEVDRKLVRLLNERTRIVEQLGRVKEQLQMPIYEPRREDEVFRNIQHSNHGPLPPDALKRLFERIVDEMRTLQRMNRESRNREDGAGGES